MDLSFIRPDYDKVRIGLLTGRLALPAAFQIQKISRAHTYRIWRQTRISCTNAKLFHDVENFDLEQAGST